MEYSSDTYNSSSSTSSQFAVYEQYLEDNRPKTTTTSSSSLYSSSLQAVRKYPFKPMLKKPIAPLPAPMKPKVYKVDPVDFKQVVQRLTSAPEYQPNTDPPAAPETTSEEVVQIKVPVGAALSSSRPRRLEEVAPPALDLSSSTAISPLRFSSTSTQPAEGNDDRANRQLLIPSPNKSTSQIPANFSELIAAERKLNQYKFSETCGAPSPLGFSFSPSSLAWCVSPLLSPGTLSFLD